MICIEEYRNIISELLDELPEEFFRDLTGGVIVSEASSIPDYAHPPASPWASGSRWNSRVRRAG